MSERWKLVDHTKDNRGEMVGYLTITLDEVRVAEAFPYAHAAVAEFVIQQAQRIVETMNAAEDARTP